MSAPIIEKIRTADNLPSLPTVAIQVLKMTQADDVSIAEIARVIQQDPALTVKILKIVNSSLFGMSRKISSVQQAMVVLGLRTVKVMALSFSLVDTLKERKGGDFDYGAYWRRSLTTAVVGRLLAEREHRAITDEAFVGGLLCDLGMLAAFHCARDLYVPVIEEHEANGGHLQDIEKRILGVTHEEITADLLDHWGLPEALCLAVRAHHQSMTESCDYDSQTRALLRILQASATIADLFCADTQAGYLESSKQTIVTGLGISEESLHEALEALDTHVKETASLFSLSIGPTRSYQEIQAEAVVQLARLSMAAELERAQIAQREQAARQKVEQLNQENQQLAQKATTDALTGVANRAALEERLKSACSEASREQRALGLLLLDLDRFKKLNDAFGHQVGDEALRLVGGCLKKLGSDTRFPARYGGEEFALVVANVTASQLRELAEEVRLAVQQLSIPFGQKRIAVTASIGAAHMEPNDPELQPKQLVERADQCLYDAKHAGRNRVAFSPPRGKTQK
ncbi:MAG: hypothetical protein AMXMBFR13_34750 [Phycisphaerae bacterium]